MASREFDKFRLVGGTSLSLQLGHRKSLDIDLFTAADYDSIDFDSLVHHLNHHFPYVDTIDYKIIGMGKSFYIGNHKDDCIKLDLCYTDKFIEDILVIDNIRMASVGEITAMKIDVISRGGRKKDFWDLHEILEYYTVQEMIELHKKRYPFSHDPELILKKLTDFRIADQDFNPICLKGKHWEIIKLAFIDLIKGR